MMHARRLSWRKALWIGGAKLGLTLALAFPRDSQGTAYYWLVDDTFPIDAHAPVVMKGQIVGRVTARTRRGDTTFLRVEFNRDARTVARRNVVWCRRFGLEWALTLELEADRERDARFVRSGRLPVVYDTLSIDRSLMDQFDGGEAESPARPIPFVWRPLPLAPPTPAVLAPRAT